MTTGLGIAFVPTSSFWKKTLKMHPKAKDIQEKKPKKFKKLVSSDGRFSLFANENIEKDLVVLFKNFFAVSDLQLSIKNLEQPDKFKPTQKYKFPLILKHKCIILEK